MSFIDPSLLIENYAWVDKLLRQKFYNYALTIDNCDEFYSAGILPENYNFELEEEIEKPVRKRSEDDISDYEDNINRILNRLGCQSPIPSNEYIKYVDDMEEDCISEITDDEDEIKIWPTKNEKENTYEDYYKKLYEEEYEEYYKDDNSELGYYGSVY
jgi:hypothetical protein